MFWKDINQICQECEFLILTSAFKQGEQAGLMRVIHLTESRWPNEYDWTMTKTNLNNWTWLKLKPTNLMKLTNLNFTSKVLLTSVQSDGASQAGQVSQPVWALSRGWGTCPSQPHQHIFWGEVSVFQCHEFWSSSKNEVHRCENFSVKF